jgi:hypothetical protein
VPAKPGYFTNLASEPNLDDLNMLLLEMNESKDETLGFLCGGIEDSIDDFDLLGDVFGPFANIFSAGTGALLVRSAYREHRVHGSMALIRLRYGSRVAGRVAAMASPIPFTGWVVRRRIEARMYINDAIRMARNRLSRVNRRVETLSLPKTS